jgi:SAM-dependent methyltransferase
MTDPSTATSATGTPASVNARVWSRGSLLKHYSTRELRPVEVILLVRYRDEGLAGRVLELGCGAGRLTGYLAALAREVHGVDLSPQMVAYCRQTLPQATFHQGDLTDLSMFTSGSFDAIVAPYNVLDVLDDADRRSVLDDVHRLLTDSGLLIMSSHNRGFLPKLPGPNHVRLQDPLRLAYDTMRLPQRWANRRRLVALERRETDYAIVNDPTQNYSLVHYYISRDDQQRQLSEHGFALLDCLDLEGQPVETGASSADCPELHYVARRVDAGS